MDDTLKLAESVSAGAVALVAVDGTEDSRNTVHEFEETHDRLIDQWSSRLEATSRQATLMALDGVYTNDLVSVPHAEDRFTAKMLEVSAEIVRLISERLSNAKDSLGGPDAGFGE